MGTTYQLPNLASYENHPIHHSSFASTISQTDRARSAATQSVFHPTSRYPAETQQALLPQPQTTSVAFAPAAPHKAMHSQQSRASTPGSGGTMTSGGTVTAQPEQSLSMRDSVMVLHSLNIPSCISAKGGSLVDFAAQVTALFWFESIKTLEAADKIRTLPPGAPVRRLTDNAIASAHFKKWVHSVLSTTQVTQNVIILALMFIYRLKVANPAVRGRPGSEYRLLTVALMLGNKFLDDNTYTNKTWADVSGIAVGEIHVMEVEFLSNMRYSLLASKDQWEEWLVKLAKFWEYCERAQQPVMSPLVIPSPTHRGFTSPLPSPTGNIQLTPSFQMTPSSNKVADHSWQHPASSPLSCKIELQARKRHFPEEDVTEPPAKRINRQPDLGLAPAQHPLTHQIPQPALPRPAQDQVRLPVPNLTLNTTNIPGIPAQPQPAQNYAPQQASALSLPPLVAGIRAMATVYPTVTTYAPQLPIPATSGPVVTPSAAVTPTTTFPTIPYGTPTKRMSPQNSLTPAAAYNSSPLTESFTHHGLTPMGNMGTASGTHTPIGHSPSIYLQQRPSPYKPVRHVNTLLYPPPSAFLQQYHLANQVPPTQMHYQPLGRRNEYRTGIVPEFAMASHGPLGALGGLHPAVTPVVMQSVQQMPINQGRPQYAPAARPPVSQYPPN